MSDRSAENVSVLVVDDNPLITNILKSLLSSEGYRVFVSENGDEALNTLGKKTVDLIICDVMMPQMDGYELHDKIRKNSELSHIPFVFLTALGDSDEISKGHEVGADDYVIKPFDPRELLALVKGKVNRSRHLKSLSEERYDSYRKKVIHTLSHEFRTPLVAINTGTELLIDQSSKLDVEKAHGVLEAIRRGGQRLEKLVNDFMILQQIEAGIARRLFENRRTKRLVEEFLGDYLESRESWFEREKFKVTLEDRTNGARFEVYEAQICDIFDRLLSNCFKFKLTDQSVELLAYTAEGEILIEVRDRGMGMDVARIKEAIDVFGQLDRDKLEQQGGGLGLAIASRFAAIHGGRIEFELRPGGGTVVTVALPVSQAGA